MPISQRKKHLIAIWDLGNQEKIIKNKMKVKLFKGLLALMLIGLFASCSQKKEDLKNGH